MPYSFDGNPFEMATIVIAVFMALLRPAKRLFKKTGPCFIFNNIIVDFLNGVAVVPFLVLIGSTFSSGLLAETLKLNKLFLTIGGIIGLLFILKEIINGE